MLYIMFLIVIILNYFKALRKVEKHGSVMRLKSKLVVNTLKMLQNEAKHTARVGPVNSR